MYHIFYTVNLLILLSLTYQDEFEYRLFEDLLVNYDPLERPAENRSKPVLVTLGIDLQQIVNLDEKNQILELNVWLNYLWKDYKMQWNPAKYGGVTDVRFPKADSGYPLWIPDVLLYNSVDKGFDTTYPSNLVVNSNGMVNWIPPGILKVSCKIDITWFPFDDQSCFLKFGSWTYHELALDLQPPEEQDGMNLKEYLQSGEWRILCVFFFSSLVLVSSSVTFSVLVLNLHFRSMSTHHMSTLVRAVLLNWLPWLLMMKRPGYKVSRQSLVDAYRKAKKDSKAEDSKDIHFALEARLSVASQNPFIQNVVSHRRNSAELESRVKECLEPYFENTEKVDPVVGGMLLLLHQLHSDLKFITDRMEKEDEGFDAESDWKFAAMVVDRLCLIIFSVFIVVSTCGILLSAPFLLN